MLRETPSERSRLFSFFYLSAELLRFRRFSRLEILSYVRWSYANLDNLRSGSIFVSLCNNIPEGNSFSGSR